MLTQAIRTIMPTYAFTTPSREELLAELEATKFTPDIATLELYEWQLFFSPDETKKDHPKHELLGDCVYKFPGFTQQNYHYWNPVEPWHNPVAMELTHPENIIRGLPPTAKIKGQVHLIRPQQFIPLDRWKQNTVEYFRRRVRLIVPFRHVLWLKDHNIDHDFTGEAYDHRLDARNNEYNTVTSKYMGRSVKTTEERVVIIRAWMYIGLTSYWDPLINLYEYQAVETFHGKNRRWCEQYYSIRRPPLPPKG